MDWQDIAVLEEFLDARMLAETESGGRTLAEALGRIRSRSGFETALQSGLFSDAHVVELALGAASLAITQAFLIPFTPSVTNLQAPTPAIEPVILSRLRNRRDRLAAPPHARRSRAKAIPALRPGRGPGGQGSGAQGARQMDLIGTRNRHEVGTEAASLDDLVGDHFVGEPP